MKNVFVKIGHILLCVVCSPLILLAWICVAVHKLLERLHYALRHSQLPYRENITESALFRAEGVLRNAKCAYECKRKYEKGICSLVVDGKVVLIEGSEAFEYRLRSDGVLIWEDPEGEKRGIPIVFTVEELIKTHNPCPELPAFVCYVDSKVHYDAETSERLSAHPQTLGVSELRGWLRGESL